MPPPLVRSKSAVFNSLILAAAASAQQTITRPPRRMSLVEEAMQFGGPAPWASRDAVWRRRGQEVLGSSAPPPPLPPHPPSPPSTPPEGQPEMETEPDMEMEVALELLPILAKRSLLHNSLGVPQQSLTPSLHLLRLTSLITG